MLASLTALAITQTGCPPPVPGPVVVRPSGPITHARWPTPPRALVERLKTAGDRRLELPLRPEDRLGGHFVQGHVDAVSEVLARRAEGDDVVMTFRLPPALRGQVVEKGSIAVDGVSLTVAAVETGAFSVALIPHTLAVTTLGRRAPGDAVNVEGDVLAKYVAALVRPR